MVALDSRTGIHRGYARLVFAGTPTHASVPFKAAAEGDDLSVRFISPVVLPLDQIRRGLGPYLADVKMSPDGLTLTARLRRPVDVRQAAYDVNTRLIDFVDHPRRGETVVKPAPAPTPKSAPASEKPAAASAKPAQPAPVPATPAPATPAPVAARVGRVGGVDRVTLITDRPVGQKIGADDHSATVTFDVPLRLDLRKLNRDLPSRLRPARLSVDRRALTLSLPPGHAVRDTQNGREITLDFIVPPPAPPAPPPAPTPVPAPAAPSKPATPPAPQPAPAAPIPAAPAPAPMPVPAAEAPADTGTDGKSAADAVTGALGEGKEDNLAIRYALVDNGVSLRFEWRQPAAAAAFRLNGAVWIVFDQKQQLDLSGFHAGNWPVVTDMAQVPSQSGTLLRLGAWNGFNPSVRRAGNAWIVELRNQPQKPDAPVEGTPRNDGPLATMVYPVADPAPPLSAIDPASGNVLVIVPLPQLGQGTSYAASFPDYDVLQSAQGLVFQPNNDGFSVRSRPSAVEVSASGGLLLSSQADRALQPRALQEGDRLLDPASWYGPAGADFNARRQALQYDAAMAVSDRKGSARLILARFFVAHDMGPEALGVLAAVNRDTPALFQDPTLRALRGAAEEISRQYDLATADLSGKDLDGHADVSLWRAALDADRRDWPALEADYAKSGEVLADYPSNLRNYLTIKLAEGLLDAGQRDKAEVLARKIIADPAATEDATDRAKVLMGRIDGIKGDITQAMSLWNEVAASPTESLARAQARYAITLTKLGKGEISRPEAIAQLDRLRFVWRGDDFEVRVLRKLGELQFEDGDYRSGFAAFRQILNSYADNPAAQGAADEMQKYFIDLFLGKAGETVAPLRALTLYDEFKELTPPGATGDAIVQKLADALVSVDLLDRAAALLENQVKTRLTGLDQARVDTRLALVRLLDDRPQDAIAALDIPVAGDLPQALAQSRLELRARALAQLGRTDDALNLLGADGSPDADRLRTDILWRAQNWPAVIPLLRKSLTPPVQGKVDEATGRAVLNLATAMALARDDAGLQALRQQYGTAMDATAFKDAFRVVAGGANSLDPGNIRALADQVSQVGDLQSFMSGYRQRLVKGRLSSLF